MSRYALLGGRLAHSYSKIIHSRFFELTGRLDSYELLETAPENIEALIKGGEYSGFNVTIPYKQTVMQYLDAVSPEAEKIGAVNTIKIGKDSVTGYNTDYFGLKETLEKNGISVNKKRVVILGTGGASKAVCALCEDLGAGEIVFVSRSGKNQTKHKTLSYNDDITGDVLFNTTPVGMYPNAGVSPLEKVSGSFSCVVDLIYNPFETELMKRAAQNGALAVNGLYMLVSQAVKAEEIWSGIKTDGAVTDKIYSELKCELEQKEMKK